MKNFLKKLDYLSPPITLYYSNSLKHSSAVSGVLTLIHYSLITFVILYYLAQVLLHNSSTSSFYRTYLDDPGIFEITDDSFFHYLTFKNGYQFDPRAMSVIGLEIRPSYFLKNTAEFKLDHWIYKNCSINFKPENAGELKVDPFGLCVQEYYNSATQQIFTKDEQGFKYPTIQHGTGNDNSYPYTIVLQGCQNKTKNDTCYSKEKIDESFDNLFSVVMHIQDKYIDVNNYSSPFVTFINSFEVGIMHDQIITSSMHFSSTIVKTHHGYIIDSVKERRGYQYDQVVRSSYEMVEDSRIASMLFFWMHNQADVYERKYLKFQDVLASISGIMKLSSCIFFVLNLIYQNYIVFDDFNNLLINLQMSYKNHDDKLFRSKSRNEKETHIGNHLRALGSSHNNYKKKALKKSIIANPMLKKLDFTFVLTMREMLSFKTTGYIKRIMNLRKKLLSEEKMIKNYIFLTDLVKLHNNDEIFRKAQIDTSLLGSMNDDDVFQKKDLSSTIEILSKLK